MNATMTTLGTLNKKATIDLFKRLECDQPLPVNGVAVWIVGAHSVRITRTRRGYLVERSA